MTRSRTSDRIVDWFRSRGNKATLRDILQSGESWAYEFRARFAEARERGIVIVCEKHPEHPSDNVYRLWEKDQGELGLSA